MKNRIVLTLRDHLLAEDEESGEIYELFNLTLPASFGDGAKFNALTALFNEKGKNGIYIGLKEIRDFARQDCSSLECAIFGFNESEFGPCPPFEDDILDHEHEKYLAILNDSSFYKQVIKISDLTPHKR